MSEKNAVTYIIVTWNSAGEILNCLHSITKYSPKESKVVIVDNLSSDNTVDVIKAAYPEVKLIASKENLGFAAANNLALDEVDTPYLCYLNPDTILTEDIISPSISVLESQQKIGLVSCQLKNVDGSHQPSCFNFANSKSLFSEILHLGSFAPKFMQKKYFLNYYKSEIPYSPEWVIGAEMIMRTAEAKKIGGFSTEYFMYTEDMDLCKKIAMILKKQVLFLPYVSLIHIGGASEVQNFNYNKQKKLFENDLYFVNKFYGKDEQIKCKKYMILAYKLRLLLLKSFYRKGDRKIQIDKTQQSIKMLQEIY